MPFGSEGAGEGTGLALSGGGFRAMLFHLGALRRLNELALLPRLDRVSSVSGGSLVAGRLAARWGRLRFEVGVASNFDEEVASPVLRLSGRLMDVPAVLFGMLPFLSAAGVAAALYRKHLLGDATLQDLPGRPRFIFNATHLATGTGWRFSRPYMGCQRLGLVTEPRLGLATAVAASAAFPPFLSPLTLSLDPARFEPAAGAHLFHRRDLRRTVALCDGGVYDNLGLETVWRRCRTVLLSDAGGELGVRPGPFRLWSTQVRRVLETAMEQGRSLRRRALVSDFRAGRKAGTVWRIGMDVGDYPVAPPFPVDGRWPSRLSAVRTRLGPFGEEERCRLVNWGYLVADVALRSYVALGAAPPATLPFPAFDFSRAPA